MANNSENVTWNALHLGARCPVNDTDADGAPVALGSANALWSEGSINKAVYDTWVLNGGVFQAGHQVDADAGLLSIAQLNNYIYQDMLYGYKGDSLNTIPGDMMSFRAYPTPIIAAHTFELQIAETFVEWDHDGRTTTTVGRFIVLKYGITLAYKVPYDVIIRVQFTPTAEIIDLKIGAGSLVVTGYKLSTDTLYTTLTFGKIYYSVDSSALTGQQVFTHEFVSVTTSPAYGASVLTPDLTVTVEEAAYAVGSPPATQLAVDAYKNPTAPTIAYATTICNETIYENLSPGGITPSVKLYKPYGSLTVVGTQMYTDPAGTIPALVGTYMSAGWAYYSSILGAHVWRITHILTLDAAGIVTTVYFPVTGVSGCGETP